MAGKPNKKSRDTGALVGRTGSGVFFDMRTDDDPRSPEAIRQEAMERARAEQRKQRKLTARQRRRLWSAAGMALIMVAASIFGVLFGDGVWSDASQAPALFTGAKHTAEGTDLAIVSPSTSPAAVLAKATPFAQATLAQPTSAPPTTTPPSIVETTPPASENLADLHVFVSKSGERYHLQAVCGNMKESKEVSLEEAREMGLTPCKRCNPPE